MLKNEIHDIIKNLEMAYPDDNEELVVEEEEELLPEEEPIELADEAELEADDMASEDDEEKNLRIQSLTALMAKKLKK